VGYIIKDEREWVFENCHGFIETNALFSNIACGFGWMPLESHVSILLYLKYDFAEFEE
jgi:hypothetical protein